MAQQTIMMFPGSRATFSHPVIGKRGFILPVTTLLVSILLPLQGFLTEKTGKIGGQVECYGS